jgi:uncharacterized protein
MRGAELRSASRSRYPQQLEVVLKVAERCNIACRYCYFFNGGDESFRHHPAVISSETTRAAAAFLREGSKALGLKAIRIVFHGGEPLMIGKRRFNEVCQVFPQNLTPAVALTLAVQTNATLIDAEWIDILQRHRVQVGVSLDGPPEYHNKDRVDFRGKGTYSSAVRGLRLLQSAAEYARIDEVSVLCVINPQHSALQIYRHFVDDLNVRHMDFLLPDVTYDTFQGQPEAYGDFLCELFDAWVGDDDPGIQIRMLSSVMSLMLGGPSLVDGYGREVSPTITIGSDGSLQPSDLLRACGPEMMASGATVTTTSLDEFLAGSLLRRLQSEYSHVASPCRRCCWFAVCGGGLMVHRYRESNRFNNPSVYCDGLKKFYSKIGAYLVTKGLPLSQGALSV